MSRHAVNAECVERIVVAEFFLDYRNHEKGYDSRQGADDQRPADIDEPSGWRYGDKSRDRARC